MAFNRAGIEKAWESIAAKGSALKESAAELGTTVKNSRAGGAVSDSAAAIHGIGLHTLGGAAMGGTINAAAYANDGAFTGADSGASAFLSGAGYGAAAGMGLGMMHAKKYAAYNAAKRAGNKQTGVWSGLDKRRAAAEKMYADPDANWARKKLHLARNRQAFDMQNRQAFDMQNRLDMASDGGPIDVLSPSAPRHPNIAPTGSFKNLPGQKPPTRRDVAKPAFKLTRDGTAHDLAAQAYAKNVKNSFMPSYDERVARQRRLAWNNRTK